MYDAGDHSVGDLAELFSVSHSTRRGAEAEGGEAASEGAAYGPCPDAGGQGEAGRPGCYRRRQPRLAVRCCEEDEDARAEGDGERGEEPPLFRLPGQGPQEPAAPAREHAARGAHEGGRALCRPRADALHPHRLPSRPACRGHRSCGRP